MRLKRNVVLIGLLGLTISFSSVLAQSVDCTVDVQPVVAKLIDAQAAAASGKQVDALQQIADAKTALEAIEAACGSPTPIVIELTNTLTAPDKSYSFNYPNGWIAGDFAPTLKIFGKGGRAIVANNELALAALTKNVNETHFATTDQAAMIIVGSANSVLYSLGLYDETNIPKGLNDVKSLTEYLLLAIKDGPLFAEIGDPKYDQQNSQFTFADKDFEGVVLLKQLDDDKYAFTLMLGGKGTRTAVAAIGTAINSSIQ